MNTWKMKHTLNSYSHWVFTGCTGYSYHKSKHLIPSRKNLTNQYALKVILQWTPLYLWFHFSSPPFSDFIEEKLGSRYVENRTVEFAISFEEASPSTPIFFILSPGVNPLKDVEDLGKQLGYTADNGNFHNVSLGQGQEAVAEQGTYCRIRRNFD